MNHPENSLKVDRLRQILDMVNARKRVALSEIEESLSVSRITVQRHLVELEKRGLLKRFHGGAMSLNFMEPLVDHSFRKTLNIQSKRLMAAKASRLIEQGMYIGLDASSTVYYLSEELMVPEVTAVTCGMDTFANLTKKGSVTPVLCGGRLNRDTGNLSGVEAVETLRRFNFDLIFISAEWFDPERGFFDLYEDEILVKRALIAAARKVVMVIDGSKIGARGGMQMCAADEVSLLITDEPSDRRLKNVFKGRLL